MRADQPRHHDSSMHLFPLRLRVALRQGVTHLNNNVFVDRNIHPFTHAGRMKLYSGDIFQNQHDYTSTRPNR